MPFKKIYYGKPFVYPIKTFFTNSVFAH